MRDRYPGRYDAPLALLTLQGNCGPLSAWLALRYLRRRVAAERIIRACRHSETHGTYTVGIALGMAELGLQVEFFSDPDPDVQAVERECYALAAARGVRIQSGISLPDLLGRINERRTAIVFYDEEGDSGHFSPLAGGGNGVLYLANEPDGEMRARDFETRWDAPGILRQCLLLSR